jgi:shikimate dehydrogenase
MDIYGILAHPAHHSLSPAMHNAGFEALNINADYQYFDIIPDNLEEFVREMPEKNIKGLSVSKPHKETIMNLLDKIDDHAKEIGAVNVVYLKDNKYHGSNVDWIGIQEPILQKTEIKNKKVIILGAGGAARAAVYAMKKSKAGSITILNRTVEHAHELAKEFNCEYGPLDKFDEAEIVIQATSAGLNKPEGVQIIPKEKIKKHMLIFEMIYTPVETQIIKDAKAIGAEYITGENMLLHQGYAAFELWTNQKAPRDIMRKAVIKNLY